MPERARLGRPLLYLAALVLFLFSAGPIFLSLLGSVIPDQALFSFPADWFGRGFTYDNYRYIFTGEMPRSYEIRGANRGMISDAARQVPGSMVNSMVVALAVMAVNVVLGAPRRLRVCPHALRQDARLHGDRDEPAGARGRARRAVLSADPGAGPPRHQGRVDPGPFGADPAVHGADPRLFPPHPARRSRMPRSSTAARGCSCSGASCCRCRCRAWPPPGSSPSCCPTPSSCSRWCSRAMPPTGRSRSSWRRSPATSTFPGGS